MEDNKRKLYDALSADYDMGDFNTFAADVEDSTKRRKLYDAISAEYDLGDFDAFTTQLLGNARAQTAAAPQAATPVVDEYGLPVQSKVSTIEDMPQVESKPQMQTAQQTPQASAPQAQTQAQATQQAQNETPWTAEMMALARQHHLKETGEDPITYMPRGYRTGKTGSDDELLAAWYNETEDTRKQAWQQQGDQDIVDYKADRDAVYAEQGKWDPEKAKQWREKMMATYRIDPMQEIPETYKAAIEQKWGKKGSDEAVLSAWLNEKENIRQGQRNEQMQAQKQKYMEIMKPLSGFEGRERKAILEERKRQIESQLNQPDAVRNAAARTNMAKSLESIDQELQVLNEQQKQWQEQYGSWTPSSARRFREQTMEQTWYDPYGEVPESYKEVATKQWGKKGSEDAYFSAWMNMTDQERQAYLHAEHIKQLTEGENKERMQTIYERAKSRGNEAGKQMHETFFKGAWSPGQAQGAGNAFAAWQAQQPTTHTLKAIEKANEIIEAYRNHQADENFFIGAFKGMKDGLSDIDNWTGVYMAGEMQNLYAIADKMEKGEALTQDEEDFLDAQAYRLAIEASLAEDLGWGYKSGNTTGASIPFMLQILASPVSVGAGGSINAINKGFAAVGKRAIKKFGKTILRRTLAMPKGLEMAGKALNIAGKVAKPLSRIVGKVADTRAGQLIGKGLKATALAAEAGVAQAFLFNSDKMAADAMERHLGNKMLAERANEQYGTNLIAKEGEEWVTAISKAVASMTAEQGSEYLGTTLLEPIGKMIARSGAGREIGDLLSGISGTTLMRAAKNSRAGAALRLMSQVKGSKVLDEIMGKAQWNGLFGEYLEELANGAVSVAIGDIEAEKFASAKHQAETILGLAWTSGALGVLRGGQRVKMYAKAHRLLAETDRTAQMYFTHEDGTINQEMMQKWEEFKASLEGKDMEGMRAELSRVMDDLQAMAPTQGGVNVHRMRLLMDYMKGYAYLMGISSADNADEQELTAEQEQAEIALAEGMTADTALAQLDIVQALAESEKRLGEMLGTENVDSWLDAMGETAEAQLEALHNDTALPDETKQAAEQYLNDRLRYEGVRTMAEEEVENRVNSAMAEFDQNTNKDTGKLTEVKMKDESTAYVVGGSLESGGNIYIRYADGRLVHTVASDVVEVLSDQQAQPVRDMMAEGVRQQAVAEIAARMQAEQQRRQAEATRHSIPADETVPAEETVAPTESAAPVEAATEDVAVPVEAAATEESAPREDADYEAMTPEEAVDDLWARTQEDEEVMDGSIQDTIEQMQQRLAEAEAAPIAAGANMTERIANRQAHNAAVAQAKASLEHWQKIAAMAEQRKAERAAQTQAAEEMNQQLERQRQQEEQQRLQEEQQRLQEEQARIEREQKAAEQKAHAEEVQANMEQYIAEAEAHNSKHDVREISRQTGVEAKRIKRILDWAAEHGVKIDFENYTTTGKHGQGQMTNASIYSGSRRIVLNKGVLSDGTAIEFIAGHELTHQAKADGNMEAWENLRKATIEAMGQERYDREFERTKRLYRQAYKNMSEQELNAAIEEEVVADWSGMIFLDPEAIDKMRNVPKTFAQKVYGWLKGFFYGDTAKQVKDAISAWQQLAEGKDVQAQQSEAQSEQQTEDVAREEQVVRYSMGGKKTSTLETALPEDESSFKGTAVSSVDGAKILKNIDNLIGIYEKKSSSTKTFIGDVANALGIEPNHHPSKYQTFLTVNNKVITLRISDHNAKASNFDNVHEEEGISLVISRSSNEGIVNDGNAHVVEFYYSDKKIQSADGKPLVDILKSIKQTLYSGVYKDITGLAEVEDVNKKFSIPSVNSVSEAAEQDENVVRFSIATEKDLQEKMRAYAKTNEGKKAGLTQAKIDAIVEETQDLINAIDEAMRGNEFYDAFADKQPTMRVDWRDGELKPTVTWSRGNIEYKYDMSADLLCVNNDGLEAVLSHPRMIEIMKNIFSVKVKDKGTTYDMSLVADDYTTLYQILKDMGFVVPCKGCFDAAGRFKMLPSVAQKFAQDVNRMVDERNKNPKKFDAETRKMKAKERTKDDLPATTANKQDAIRVAVTGDQLTEHIDWTQLMSAEGQDKMLAEHGGIFRAWQKTGAGRPKDKLNPEPYYGDIVSQTTTIIGAYGDKTPSYRDMSVNQGTGLRRNSHSEFRPVLTIDEIQMMRDAFVRGLTVFKYTKELDDVRIFGQMGTKFNMSFFPEHVKGTKVSGLDINGNYIASEESVGAREHAYTSEDGAKHYDGMKGFEEALALCNKDVSLSSVIFSVPHLIKALTDVPTVSDKSGIWGSLIPFHSSGATTASLAAQGLGMARANGVGHSFDEAMYDYGKGVTNFEAVQNDRFGEGWVILQGKKAGTAVEAGHKIEFANGTHYYNEALGVHLFAGGYALDSELDEKGKEALNSPKTRSEYVHPFSIDYNDKVREIGTTTAYQDAADFYLQKLPELGLMPRFNFEVAEATFLQMCEDAKVDPRHPKLGWKGEGNSWSPTDAESYYALFCDYGMTDPENGEWAPHRPVGYINENGEREFRLPDNVVEIATNSLNRYSETRRAEDALVMEAIDRFEDTLKEQGRLEEGSRKLSITAEEQSIIDAAKANGTYMKAPNGQPTNLNEKQWAQVRTKAFKEWFGDWENDPENSSKVVDENGEPMVVYHYTPNEFTEFDADKIGSSTDVGAFGTGFYFSPSDKFTLYGTNKMAVFINAKNPMLLNDSNAFEAKEPFFKADYKWDNESAQAFADDVQAKGYDAVYYENRGMDEIVAFSPTQIKSATDNVGTFDAENGDIRYSMPARMKQLEKAENFIRRNLKAKRRGLSFEIYLPVKVEKEIRKRMGRDFESHNITINGVAHGLNNHGVNGTKLTATSIPVTEENATLIPYIMVAPDRVERGSTDASGRESIRFIKNLSNGVVVVVEKEYKNSPDDMETINIWADLSSEAINAQQKAAPGIHVQNAILDIDVAKIRKDAEDAIRADVEYLQKQANATPGKQKYSIYGGNKGYVGYSMSKRAASAREEGRFPKTDFKKEYGVTDASLNALVNAGLIDNTEWHHTSVRGNRTPFYGWTDPSYADYYTEHKAEIDKAARELAKAEPSMGDFEATENGMDEFSRKHQEWTEQRDAFVQQMQNEFDAASEAWHEQERVRQEQAHAEWLEKTEYENYVRNLGVPAEYDASNGVHVVTNGNGNPYAWQFFWGDKPAFRKYANAAREELEQYVKDNKGEVPSFEEWREEQPLFSLTPIAGRGPNESFMDYANRVAREVERQRNWQRMGLNRVLARKQYEERVASGWYQTQEALQDSMLGLKALMESIAGKGIHIEDIPDFENPYLGENRLSSVNQAESEMFARMFIKPMLEEIAKLARNEQERDILTNYAMAKHGLERNLMMATRDAQRAFADPNNTETLLDLFNKFRKKDYAGLTGLTGKDTVAAAEQEAQQMVDDYEQAHNTDELWAKIDAVNNAILLKQKECGLLGEKMYKEIRAMYDYYIPLRGFDEKTIVDAYAYLDNRAMGEGSVVQRAQGRTSKADNPWAYLQSMADQTIMQGNRNKLVKEKLLTFVTNHPSDAVSLSRVWMEYDPSDKRWYVRMPKFMGGETSEQVAAAWEELDREISELAEQHPNLYKTGREALDLPFKVPDEKMLKEHQVLVRTGAGLHIITINGSPRAAQAVNGQTNPDKPTGTLGAVVSWLEGVNRFMSQMYTSSNPDFIYSNWIRDSLYGNSMMWVKESPAYARRFNANWAKYNPKAVRRLLIKYKEGTLDMNNYTEALFNDFMMNGGETGYSIVHDIEAHKTAIKKEMQKLSGDAGTREAIGALLEKLENISRAVENATRFAAFVTSMEEGRGIGRSIWDAKEVSVNFNKKGAGDKFWKANGQTKAGNAAAFMSGFGRMAYIFWNAALQGTTNTGRQLKRHPVKALSALAVSLALGYLSALAGTWDGDDDDEKTGEKELGYLDLPEYTRRSNMVIKTVKGHWLTIPLPIEYRALYGLGELAGVLMSGKQEMSGGTIAWAVAQQLAQVMPVDMLSGNNGWLPFVPSALSPLAQVLSNNKWTGQSLWYEPEDKTRAEMMPEWAKAYKGTDRYLVALTKGLSNMTGGDDVQGGMLDLNPAAIETLLDGHFGAISTMSKNLMKSIEMAAGVREYDPRYIPIWRRMVAAENEQTQNYSVNADYRELKETYDEMLLKMRDYQKKIDDGREDYEEKLEKLENSDEGLVYEIFEDYKDDIKFCTDELREAEKEGDEEEIKEAKAALQALKREIVEEVRAARKEKDKKKEGSE